MKVEIGKRYIRKDGQITGVLTKNDSHEYPFIDHFNNQSYASNGAFNYKEVGDKDLISEYVESTKKLNFWEARQAALDGKKVRCNLSKALGGVTAEHFKDSGSWSNKFMYTEWEIIEEPKTSKHYINIFDCGLFLYPADDGVVREWPCKGTIEIITDENGKLISAKNV